MKVVIFSDSQIVTSEMELVFSSSNAERHYVSNRTELFALLKQKSFDILLLDLNESNDLNEFNEILELNPDTFIFLKNNRIEVPSNQQIRLVNNKNYIEQVAEHLSSTKSSKFENEKECFVIKINNKYKQIRKSEIESIKADGKYAELQVGDRKYSVRISLKAINLLLPSYFLRVHASYITNLRLIDHINSIDNCIEMISGKTIQFSRSYKMALFEQFSVI